MASFKQILAQLKKQEHQALKQLTGIRNAIASLSFGGWVPPAPGRGGRGGGGGRKRRRFSAATRAKMAAAQRARWAKRKAGK